MTNQNDYLKSNARSLRNNMTDEERKLWYLFLSKKIPKTVRRQAVLRGYIVDFFCPEAKLVIEIDGSQHYDEEMLNADRKRDAVLKAGGLTVLRYSNRDINQNFNNVCEDIWNHIMK